VASCWVLSWIFCCSVSISACKRVFSSCSCCIPSCWSCGWICANCCVRVCFCCSIRLMFFASCSLWACMCTYFCCCCSTCALTCAYCSVWVCCCAFKSWNCWLCCCAKWSCCCRFSCWFSCWSTRLSSCNSINCKRSLVCAFCCSSCDKVAVFCWNKLCFCSKVIFSSASFFSACCHSCCSGVDCWIKRWNNSLVAVKSCSKVVSSARTNLKLSPNSFILRVYSCCKRALCSHWKDNTSTLTVRISLSSALYWIAVSDWRFKVFSCDFSSEAISSKRAKFCVVWSKCSMVSRRRAW